MTRHRSRGVTAFDEPLGPAYNLLWASTVRLAHPFTATRMSACNRFAGCFIAHITVTVTCRAHPACGSITQRLTFFCYGAKRDTVPSRQLVISDHTETALARWKRPAFLMWCVKCSRGTVQQWRLAFRGIRLRTRMFLVGWFMSIAPACVPAACCRKAACLNAQIRT